MSQNPASMSQLAEQLNVAVSTVSRALAGDSGVSRKRALEIRQLADQLGYRPRAFRRKQTNAIGLVIASDKPEVPDNSYLYRLVAMVERRAAGFGWHVHVVVIDRSDCSGEIPLLIQEGRVDGVLLAGHPPEELCWKLQEQPVPVVAINDSAERIGLTCVTHAPLQATREAIDRLAALGHRRYGLVLTDRRYPTIARRAEAWSSALRNDEIPEDDCCILEGFEDNMGAGQKAVEEFCRRGELPTVMIFANDFMAMGGMFELARRGYRVPEDVSVFGYDNVLNDEDVRPALTSVDLRLPELAELALKRLRQHQEDPDANAVTETLQAKLIWRESCGPASK